jgi:hypothetical protein
MLTRWLRGLADKARREAAARPAAEGGDAPRPEPAEGKAVRQ